MIRRFVIAVFVLLGLAGTAGAAPRAALPEPPVRVYLMRGLFDVFSLGLNSLETRLRRAGYLARTYSVANAPGVEAEIVQRLRADPAARIVVIGHSLGADAAVRIANRVGREGLPPLGLVVTFDPVSRLEVTGGTRMLVNLFQSNNGWAVPLRPAPGFAGSFANEDLRDVGRINHLTIDKDRALHEQVLALVAAVAAGPEPATRRAPVSRRRAP